MCSLSFHLDEIIVLKIRVNLIVGLVTVTIFGLSVDTRFCVLRSVVITGIWFPLKARSSSEG
jgi:hypothetical protein